MILFFKKKSQKIINEMLSRKIKAPGGACIVYFPPDSELKLCEKMVKKGLLKKEMVEGGFMLADDYKMIYEIHEKSPEVAGTVYSQKGTVQ